MTLTPESEKELQVSEDTRKSAFSISFKQQSPNPKINYSKDSENSNSTKDDLSNIDEKCIVSELKSPKLSDRQEARVVCSQISQLLQDKRSKTRGSCMFRKRRKRSEKFAIVGYGTQPVVGEATGESTEEERTDSVFLTSSDDEIDVYDKPGYKNLVLEDQRLTIAEKVVQNQFKKLTNDTKTMKGKGAIMFARRQKRMEQFVIGNNPEEQPEGTNYESAMPGEKCFHQENNDEAQRGETSPIVEKGGSIIHIQEEVLRQRPMNDEQLSTNETTFEISASTKGRSRPKERMPYSSSSNTDASNCSDSLIDDKSDSISHLDEKEENYSSLAHIRAGFRSVKPPCPGNFPLPSPEANQTQDFNWNRKGSSFPQFTPKTNRSNKTWCSVKFQPKAKESSKPSEEQNKTVVYPCTLLSSNDTRKKKTSSSIKLARPYQPYKSVYSVPFVSKPRSSSHDRLTTNSPTSVQLLQKPLTEPYPAPRVVENFLKQTKSEEKDTKVTSVRGDLTPKSVSPTSQQREQNYRSSSHQQRVTTFPKHFNRPAQRKNAPTELKQTEPQEDQQKPKVAACMKLLDPSKGKYEPKVAIVYQQTPSAGTKFNTQPSNERTPIQFNKPRSVNHNVPQISYLSKNTNSSANTKPQPLGALAGELKGKGARMFEKQQKRMDHFTKESNGAGILGTPAPHSHSNCKGPETKTKENMSQVVGEFKKVSANGNAPRRPSLTRTIKMKDPYHYHSYYLPNHGPSANDFVCSDDYGDRASESNVSTTSSMTSCDRYSRTSSNICQWNEDEGTDASGVKSVSKDEKFRPVIAPKPKLFSGGQAVPFEHFPAPPSYSDATAQQFLQSPNTKSFAGNVLELCQSSDANGEM